MLDRVAITTALAKCLSYKASGKHDLADEWGRILAELLRQADIQF